MSYAESTAYISHADLVLFLGASVVADLFVDSSGSLAHRNAASGVLNEFATSAGLELPLESGHVTYAMKRRLALIAAHMGASDLKPEYRNDRGRGPYHDGHDRALAELKEWQAGVRAMPNDTEADPVRADTFCVTNRRRNWTRGR